MPAATLQIVGAGPAGLAAAIQAARHGVRVLVGERRADVGGRFHDDFQGLENWSSDMDVMEELETLGIAPTFQRAGVREQTCFDASGREYVFRSNRPFYYLVRRGSTPGTLDRALRDQAVAAGVEIRFGETVERVPEGGVVARGPRQGDVIAVGYVFDTSAGDACYGVVDDRLAPQGYGYLLIRNGHGTLATCMFSDFHSERMYLERTTEFFRARLGLAMDHPRRFGGMGTFSSGRFPGQRRVVMAGEAAGLQDALWGFGMRYAIRSGVLAARRVALLGDARAAEAEEQRLMKLYRAGCVNRFLYARLGNRGYAVLLGLMARAADPRAWLGRRYAPSLVKSWLAPLAEASQRRAVAAACDVAGCDCTWCRCHRNGGRDGE